MGFLNQAIFGGEERGSALLKNPPDWFLNWFGGGAAWSGVKVSEDSALTLSAFYAAVRIISEDTASLPLFVFERSYGLYFLEQFGERWRFFRPDESEAEPAM